MSDVATPAAPTAQPTPAAPARWSDMGNASFTPQLAELPPPAAAAAEANSAPKLPEATPMAAPGSAEQGLQNPDDATLSAENDNLSAEAQTPEQLAAEWQKHKDSPDLDLEAFGDKVIWTRDRDGNPVPMRVADVEKHALLYRDYQHKTTELARQRQQFQQQEAGMNQFRQDLLSGDPEAGMRAMRYMGADKTMHALVVSYVQRMARLEGMEPGLRDHFLDGERARDEAIMLKRQLAARQQAEQQWQEQQAQQQGIQAPDIQHVMGHIETRLPALCKELRVTESPAFDRELGEVLVRATEGQRGPDGRWITAPVIQRGRTPTDDVLRQLVGEAKERVDALIAAASGRQPPRQQLPPPPAAAAVSGPAARPGQRGNLSQPERKRFSDMR